MPLFAVGEDDVAEVLVGLAEHLPDPALLRVVDEVLLVQHQDVGQITCEAISGITIREGDYSFCHYILNVSAQVTRLPSHLLHHSFGNANVTSYSYMHLRAVGRT